MAGGVEYTATVAKNLIGVDGEPLQGEVRWKFSTAPPRVVSVSPQTDGAGFVRVDAAVVVAETETVDVARTSFTAWEVATGVTPSAS